MLRELPALERLVRLLQGVPYLASKNVYKVALHFLESSDKQLDGFIEALLEAKKSMKHCGVCFNWTQAAEQCFVCTQPRRNKRVICVVETWHDLLALEKAGGYDGVYHVLGGALSPLEGIGPDALRIAPLLKRIEGCEVQELIFATNPTPEGEATASYISSKLKDFPLAISKLASGVPIGSSLESMDRITVYKALLGRRPY
jgi:recombination protein RecR